MACGDEGIDFDPDSDFDPDKPSTPRTLNNEVSDKEIWQNKNSYPRIIKYGLMLGNDMSFPMLTFKWHVNSG